MLYNIYVRFKVTGGICFAKSTVFCTLPQILTRFFVVFTVFYAVLVQVFSVFTLREQKINISMHTILRGSMPHLTHHSHHNYEFKHHNPSCIRVGD